MISYGKSLGSKTLCYAYCKRCFSGPARADDADQGPLGDREAHVVQQYLAAGLDH